MIPGIALLRAFDLAAGWLGARRLAARDRWSRERLLVHQRAAFAGMVRHAAAASSFYAQHYRGLDLDGEIDPARLPITNKRLLMENLERVVTDPRLTRPVLERHLAEARGDGMLFGRYRVVASAGTSGLRGIFVYDRAAWRVVLANTLRWQAFAGIAPSLTHRVRICSIGADNPMHVTTRIPMSSDVGLFGLMHLQATEPVAKLVAALHAFRPDVLAPYPSVAALLAREQIAGRLSIAPRVVVTHSELLTPEMARLIEQAWGSRPFNHYGMTEEPHVAGDCPAHAGLHVFEDTSLVEVVDDDYRPVPDGGMGTRYLLTNLYNRAQPLIRYEVTDMLCRSPMPCPCGRPFALLSSIGGRAEDMLRLPRADGLPGTVAVTPMVIGLAVESFIGVREYAVEHDAQGIRMRLVVPEEADRRRIAEALPARIAADLSRHGAAAPPGAIEFIEQLPRSGQRMGKIAVVARRKAEAA